MVLLAVWILGRRTFYRARGCPTDRLTHRPRYIGSSRPHLVLFDAAQLIETYLVTRVA